MRESFWTALDPIFVKTSEKLKKLGISPEKLFGNKKFGTNQLGLVYDFLVSYEYIEV